MARTPPQRDNILVALRLDYTDDEYSSAENSCADDAAPSPLSHRPEPQSVANSKQIATLRTRW